MAFIFVACSFDLQRRDPGVDLTVLTLNLHTYQELQTAGTEESELTSPLAQRRIERYGPIFDRIAAGISELDPDIICLQEVGEWSEAARDHPESVAFGASSSNMVHQILSRLENPGYNYTMDWSHLGWQTWMEGSAILSKYPIIDSGSRFISHPGTGRYASWKSRNVPMARLNIPSVGSVGVFSVHMGWWDDPEDPFQGQFERLLDWSRQVAATTSVIILCGDFNAPAGGPAYRLMTSATGFTDQYLLANPGGMFDATIGGAADGWEQSESGQRIDYVLMNEDSPLHAVRARRVFSAADFGSVSDHMGVYVEFRLAGGDP